MNYGSLPGRIFSRMLIVSMSWVILSTGALFLTQSASARSATDPNTSYVRVIHASPYVGTADVFVDGQSLLSAFQFAAVTNYVSIPSGAHKVQISLLGKGINASLITQDLQVPPGKVFTVAAVGATPSTLGLQVFQDDNQVVANHAKVRVYHLSPDAGTVNVNVGGDQNLNNVAYEQASDYLTMDTGSCDFTVSDPQYSSTLPLSLNLQANVVTSLFTVGLYQGTPKIQLVTAQVPGIPGLPQTGNNPFTLDLVSPSTSWAFIAIVFALIGAGAIYRFKRARVA